MKGGFQRSLWLFIVNEYCVFEDDVCVDPSGVLDERPNYANITFSGFFSRPCTSRPEVIDKGPDYAADLLSGFYAGVRCPPVLHPLKVQRSRCKAEIRRAFERSASVSYFFSSFHLFHFFFLSPLPLFFGN